MKFLLVVLAYVSSGGVGGGVAMDVQIKEVPTQQACQDAGEALRAMGGKSIKYQCVAYAEP